MNLSRKPSLIKLFLILSTFLFVYMLLFSNGYKDYLTGFVPLSSTQSCVDLSGLNEYVVNNSTEICPGTYLMNDSGNGSIIINASNISLDCGGATILGNDSGVGVYLSNKSNVTINNCIVSNYSTDLYVNNSTMILIRNNSISNSTNYGLYLHYSSNNNVSNNTLYGSKYNLYVYGNTKQHYNNSIDASNIIGGYPVYYLFNRTGIILNGTANLTKYVTVAYSTNVTLVNLNISGGDPIRFVHVNNSMVNNSSSSNNPSSGIVLSYSSNNTLVNLVSNQNYVEGIYLYNSSNNTLSNISVHSNSNYGIHLSHSKHNLISNVVADFSKRGIFLASSSNHNIIINSNFSTNSGGTLLGGGVFIDHSDYNLVFNNTLNSNSYYGVYTESSNFNNVSSNYLKSNHRSIYIKDSLNNSISNNLVNLSITSGIRLYGSRNSTVINNRVYQTGGSNGGISLVVNSNYNHLINNTANSNHYYGFVMTTNSIKNILANNTAKYNSRHGLYMSSVSYNNITNNNFSLNSQDGAYVYGTGNNFLNNELSSNSKNGIYLVSSGNTLTSNYVNSNGDYGIYLKSTATLKNNTVQENGKYDLYLSLTSSSYCNMLISNTTGSGNRPIQFLNTPTNLTNKSVSELILCNADNSNMSNVRSNGSTNLKNNGILMLFSDNTNLSNSLSVDNYVGLYLSSSSNNYVYSNNFSENALSGINLTANSENNLIYNNYFENNSANAYDPDSSSTNKWNVTKQNGTNIIGGSYIAGNYWSDYQGQDFTGDGIGDDNLPYTSSKKIKSGGDYTPLTIASDCLNLSGMNEYILNKSATLCPGVYHMNDTDKDGAIIINSNNISFNCAYSVILGNFTEIGINALSKSNVSVSNCIIKQYQYGLYLKFVNNTSIYNSSFTLNNISGILLNNASNNLITNNNISNNNLSGINITTNDSINNSIYNNYFSNNGVNAYDLGNNSWNTTKQAGTNIVGGPFIAGNYWDDYNGTDTNHDYIGDTYLPYNSSQNISIGGDYLPLILYVAPTQAKSESGGGATAPTGPTFYVISPSNTTSPEFEVEAKNFDTHICIKNVYIRIENLPNDLSYSVVPSAKSIGPGENVTYSIHLKGISSLTPGNYPLTIVGTNSNRTVYASDTTTLIIPAPKEVKQKLILPQVVPKVQEIAPKKNAFPWNLILFAAGLVVLLVLLLYSEIHLENKNQTLSTNLSI